MGYLQYMGWHTQIVLCTAPSEKKVNVCCGFKRMKNHSWTTRKKNSSDQGNLAVWIYRWAHLLMLQMSNLKEIPVLRYKEYKTHGKEKKEKTPSSKTSGLGGTNRICPCFYSRLGKDMQSRLFQKVSDTCSNNRAKRSYPIHTGINGNEVGRSLSDIIGLSSVEPSRQITDRKTPKSTVLLWQQKNHWLWDVCITIICDGS